MRMIMISFSKPNALTVTQQQSTKRWHLIWTNYCEMRTVKLMITFKVLLLKGKLFLMRIIYSDLVYFLFDASFKWIIHVTCLPWHRDMLHEWNTVSAQIHHFSDRSMIHFSCECFVWDGWHCRCGDLFAIRWDKMLGNSLFVTWTYLNSTIPSWKKLFLLSCCGIAA